MEIDILFYDHIIIYFLRFAPRVSVSASEEPRVTGGRGTGGWNLGIWNWRRSIITKLEPPGRPGRSGRSYEDGVIADSDKEIGIGMLT